MPVSLPQTQTQKLSATSAPATQLPAMPPTPSHYQTACTPPALGEDRGRRRRRPARYASDSGRDAARPPPPCDRYSGSSSRRPAEWTAS
ncbi:hypothetical protein BDV59DRAFT_166751 [Aspergillus ambiguus]|uniref:uncharacterized protein n=1 Tax=Aspergillus ambiguus TaxID=176160 RepID=UPI003CCE1CA3